MEHHAESLGNDIIERWVHCDDDAFFVPSQINGGDDVVGPVLDHRSGDRVMLCHRGRVFG